MPDELSTDLGFELSPGILELAFTHRSYSYEHDRVPTNERLEFLGDSVLGLVVTDLLYTSYPDLPEGQLAKMRASVVNMRALADVARTLGLGAHLRLGRGEEISGGRDKTSILADALEALFGAVYVELGVEAARSVVRRLMEPVLRNAATTGAGLDWKTNLQEFTASAGLGVPEYLVTEEGPDHAKVFHAAAVVGGVVHGRGTGPSKKEAEQKAAATAHAGLQSPDGTPALPTVEDTAALPTVGGAAALPSADGTATLPSAHVTSAARVAEAAGTD